MFVSSPIGTQHWREREGRGDKANGRLDRSSDGMSEENDIPTFYFSDKSLQSAKVMDHQNETYSLIILYKRLPSLICHLFTYNVSPFSYFPSLINPINTNLDIIFHFVFIQTGPVYNSDIQTAGFIYICCWYAIVTTLMSISLPSPLPHIHVNHYLFLK